MREIKFRAWDKNKKEWMKDTFLISCDGDIIIVFPGGSTRKQYALFIGTDVDVFQYTGLKDKNGVEIYEGDIIQYQHVLGEEYWENKKIEWSESLAGWIIDRRDSGLSVVIGNVHENPELLKV